ncbi:family 43 glycosylhydrolase [Anaerosporobacter faecicola]|uniref:family 43 glycosylhydrolase n=1 Tax=Anaerosporobacter faecicola TaxID=2718714 RepID=UPI00143C3A10|nr:family 43 glycosylhydrolase [Anaerosporobacter faecicola]
MNELSEDQIKKGGFRVTVSCHDPEIVVGEDGTYYMFGSHMIGAKSNNLREWDYFAQGVDQSNPLFDNLFEEKMEAFSFVGKNAENGYSVWAPNVYYNERMNKYIMYYCTTSSYIKSSICMATADQIEGPYTHQAILLDSGYSKKDIETTNVYDILGKDADTSRYFEYGGYNNKQWPNCIDPAIVKGEDDRIWMVYGSWSGGIFLLEIDPETGYPINPQQKEEKGVDAYYGVRLVGGGHHSIEGPYIEYSAETGYYYLFLSYGELKQQGGYQIRVFRSKEPTGPYVDAEGNTLEDQEDHSNYGVKLMGNYTFPSLNYTYMAPGGQSTFRDKDGRYYITYHQRFAENGEYFEPRVHQMVLNEDDWFVILPFATVGEKVSETGYKTENLKGSFYLVNHGTDIGSTVHTAECVQFNGKGTFTKDEEKAEYEVQPNSNYVTIKMGNVVYKGVIVEMEDEAGNATLCISAVGENNESLWFVQYVKQ